MTKLEISEDEAYVGVGLKIRPTLKFLPPSKFPPLLPFFNYLKCAEHDPR